jgi:hypothetical protein
LPKAISRSTSNSYSRGTLANEAPLTAFWLRVNHQLQGFASKTGRFLQLIFADVFVLGRYIIEL